MLCLALSLWIYFAYYAVQQKTDKKYPLETPAILPTAKLMRMVPSTGYSLLIIPMNLIYKKLAIFMTNYGRGLYEIENECFYLELRFCLENHRLQTSYENNLTSKLFVFYFMNCFIGLFYEAFFNANYGNVAQVNISSFSCIEKKY